MIVVNGKYYILEKDPVIKTTDKDGICSIYGFKEVIFDDEWFDAIEKDKLREEGLYL